MEGNKRDLAWLLAHRQGVNRQVGHEGLVRKRRGWSMSQTLTVSPY